MYQNDSIISKSIVAPDGENTFRIRYIRNENVGIATTESDTSYFLLDSEDYWYDLIQKSFPPVMKCSCKNDRFYLTFNYTLREDTDDFKEISILCSCTACRKTKSLPTIEIDYSPSHKLFEAPITFCKQPKIKYKTFSAKGYWSEKELLRIAEYFAQNNLFIYSWYWESETEKRCFKELSSYELNSFLIENKVRYIAIYFSENPFRFHPMKKESVFLTISGEKNVFLSCTDRAR